jgi:hypothetical protein
MKLGLGYSFVLLTILSCASLGAAEEMCADGVEIEACAAVLQDQLSNRGAVGANIYCCEPKESSGRTFFRVVTVREGMAFSKAGIEADDYISLAAIGDKVLNPRSREEFGALHDTLKKGETVKYLVLRADGPREVDVVAGPPSQEWIEFGLWRMLSEAGFSDEEIKRWSERKAAAG